MGGTTSTETPQEEVKAGNPLGFSSIFPKQCGHTWWSHTCAPLLLTLTAQKLLYLRKSRAKLGLGMCERQNLVTFTAQRLLIFRF